MCLVFDTVHATVIQKEMSSIVIIYPIDGMVGNDILFASQEATNVCRQCLTIPCQFRIRTIAGNVIDHVLGNMRSRSVGKSGRMRKGIMRIQETFARSSVHGNEFFHFF